MLWTMVHTHGAANVEIRFTSSTIRWNEFRNSFRNGEPRQQQHGGESLSIDGFKAIDKILRVVKKNQNSSILNNHTRTFNRLYILFLTKSGNMKVAFLSSSGNSCWKTKTITVDLLLVLFQ